MGHDDHGAALLRQLAHHLQHFAHQFGIERRGRLVEQHHVGFHAQRPGNGDALLLATRQARWIIILALGKPDALEHRFGPLAHFGPGLLQHRQRTFHHVLQHRHVGPQVELLEHHAKLGAHVFDLAHAFRPGIAMPVLDDLDVIALQVDFSGGRHLKQVDAAQEGAFSRARRAEDRDNVALFRRQRNAAQHLHRPERLVDILDDQRVGGVLAHGLTSFPALDGPLRAGRGRRDAD